MRSAGVALLAAVSVAMSGVAPAQEKVGAETIFQLLARTAAQRCAQARAVEPSATHAEARLNARMDVELHCDCMPAEIERRAKLPAAPRAYTEPEADALAQRAVNSCSLRSTRKHFAEICELTRPIAEPVEGRRGFCACFAEGMKALSEAELLRDITLSAAYAKLRNEARKAGKPDPPEPKVPSDPIKQRCNAAQGSPAP